MLRLTRGAGPSSDGTLVALLALLRCGNARLAATALAAVSTLVDDSVAIQVYADSAGMLALLLPHFDAAVR